MTKPFATSDMPESLRRGACPTLDAPMRTGDGLLARIRVAGGVLAPRQLAGLCRLARLHGNGMVEVTARGNLQVRGLTPETAPAFANGVTGLIEVETGLVVDFSPISGIDPHERADAGSLALRIRQAAADFGGRLGPKVSVVVDGGGQVSLAALKADIRLLALDAARWSVTLGGGKPQIMDADGALAATMALLGALAAMGPDTRASDLFPPSGAPSPLSSVAVDTGSTTCRLELRNGHTRAIALPFGQMDAPALAELCAEAASASVTAIRLAPDHTILLDNAPESLVRQAGDLGFITEPGDPRRRISACIGNQGCASGHIAARQIASRLAVHLPAGKHLHVSGCAKGCAQPRRAEVTLVGRADGIGLVIDGRAGDTPGKLLDEAALVAALAPSQDRQ